MKKIRNTIFVLGLLLIFGTAGAADLNTISITQMIIQGVIGLSMMAVGGIQ